MKRYVVIGELVIIGILIALILMDFTGVGRKTRKQYNEIDHSAGTDLSEVVSVAPLDDGDPYVYHKDGDQYIAPTNTPTPTPTPTPTLSPEEQIIKNGIDEAYAYTIPNNIAFADVTDYLSIRREPSGDSARLGLMNDGDSCIVQALDGEWAYVKSGTVSGYCLAKHLIQGKEATQYAKEHVVYTATVTGNVNVRSTPTTLEDNVVSYLSPGDTVNARTPALRSDGDSTTPLFIEVEYQEGKFGYIASNKATISYSWPVGRAIDDRKVQ